MLHIHFSFKREILIHNVNNLLKFHCSNFPFKLQKNQHIINPHVLICINESSVKNLDHPSSLTQRLLYQKYIHASATINTNFPQINNTAWQKLSNMCKTINNKFILIIESVLRKKQNQNLRLLFGIHVNITSNASCNTGRKKNRKLNALNQYLRRA